MLKAACGFVPGDKSKGKLSYYVAQVHNGETSASLWQCEHKHDSPGNAVLCAEAKLRELKLQLKNEDKTHKNS